MSDQIEADEVAQFVAKAANFDTPSGVSVVVSAVCRNSKTARNGGTPTLKSSRPIVPFAMSNQIEADEMRGWTEIEPKFESQRQAFQRRRDNLVVSIEREGMSCFNVVTLPENFDQDNQVIDCIELGVELEDAVETARAFMEQR